MKKEYWNMSYIKTADPINKTGCGPLDRTARKADKWGDLDGV
jgi:hypothetical protein